MRSPKDWTRSSSRPDSNGASRATRCALPPMEKRWRRGSARSRPPTAILSAGRGLGRVPIWQAPPVRRPRRLPARLLTFGRWGADMPKPFNKLTATAAPIMRGNIDTDVIIRIERLVGNSVRGSLGKWACGALRYLPDGSENPEFMLNREPYRQAEILVAGPNFGCGFSSGGAVGALQGPGMRPVGGSWRGE